MEVQKQKVKEENRRKAQAALKKLYSYNYADKQQLGELLWDAFEADKVQANFTRWAIDEEERLGER